MSNGDEAMWYYESAGQPAGPIAESALRELLRSGELSPGARVWRAGMAGWQPARSAPGLEGAAAARHRLARVDLLFVVLLSLVTLGVYGAVKFYQAAKAYQALAPARASSFDTLFWSCVGIATAGVLASIPVAVL